MEYIEMFFAVPVKWTFECNHILFSLYMWFSFGIPTLIGYAYLFAIAFSYPNGKIKNSFKIFKKIVLMIIMSLLQFVFVLGIGNIIYYTDRW